MTQYLEELKKLIGHLYSDDPQLLAKSATVLEKNGYPITERCTPPDSKRIEDLPLETDIKAALIRGLYEAHRNHTGPHSSTIALSQLKMPLGERCMLTSVDYLLLKTTIEKTALLETDRLDLCFVYFSIKDAIRCYEAQSARVDTIINVGRLARVVNRGIEARKAVEVRVDKLEEVNRGLRAEIRCLKRRKNEKE
jgi:hypothetical protein